jgi:HAD superfamily hydrolase (TIGR01484 family)
VRLAYVTGRHREKVIDAIERYSLPRPDYVVADVGTSLFVVDGDEWRELREWAEEIRADWGGRRAEALRPIFEDLVELRLQEERKQGPAKLSYYTRPDVGDAGLVREMKRRLDEDGVRAEVVFSVDEVNARGLVDVLPARAGKRFALEFLLEGEGYAPDEAVFAGDSGNDLSVLVGPLRAVLVANATDEVKAEARRLAAESGHEDRLYVARGGWRGMNGNYAAGILEGVVWFEPETEAWYE